MKLIKSLSILFAFVIVLSYADATLAASTATQTAQAASVSGITDKAKEILNKITDKVTQIGTNLKKGYTGKVRSLGNNTISLTYDSGEIFAEINDATNFYKFRSGNRTTSDFKSIKVGTELTIIGILDEGNHTVIARQVIDKIRRFQMAGRVTSIKKELVTISNNGTDNIIDTSTVATVKKIGLKRELTSGRIADIAIGDFVSALGYFDDGDPNLQALKVLYIPQSLFTTPSPTLTPSVSPTASPSGKVKN